MGHPRRIPSATCPKHDGVGDGPKRPEMRIGSTPLHTRMARPPTQGGVGRGLLEPE